MMQSVSGVGLREWGKKRVGLLRFAFIIKVCNIIIGERQTLNTTTTDILPFWAGLLFIQPIDENRILDVTFHKGHTIEDFVTFLEVSFQGVTQRLANIYLDYVLASMPASNMPSRKIISEHIPAYGRSEEMQQKVRDSIVAFYIREVNKGSPNWMKRCMAAMIEYYLGNFATSLHQAGFAECEYDNPNFQFMMESHDCSDRMKNILLKPDIKKATILAQLINQRQKD